MKIWPTGCRRVVVKPINMAMMSQRDKRSFMELYSVAVVGGFGNLLDCLHLRLITETELGNRAVQKRKFPTSGG